MPDPLELPVGRLVLSPTAVAWLVRDLKKRSEIEMQRSERTAPSDFSAGTAASSARSTTESKIDDAEANGDIGPATRALRQLAKAGESRARAGDGSATKDEVSVVVDRMDEAPVADCVCISPIGTAGSMAHLLAQEAKDRAPAASSRSGSGASQSDVSIAIGHTSPLFSKCLAPHFGLKVPGGASAGGMTAAEKVMAALTAQQQALDSSTGESGEDGGGLNLGGLQTGTLSWLERLAGEAECKQRLIQFGGIISVRVPAGTMGVSTSTTDEVV